MKTREIPEHDPAYITEVDRSVGPEGAVPAAALWMIRPLPPPSKSKVGKDEMKQLEKSTRRLDKGVNFWLALKKARVHARETHADGSNKSLANPEPPVTFHGAMRLTLFAGQMFGLNPVRGVLARDTTELRFTVASWCFVYSLLSLTGQFMVAALCVARCFRETLDFSSTTSVMFYGGNCVTTALFLRVATRWPALCRRVVRCELAEPCTDRTLPARCNTTMALILFLALMEHVFSIVAGLSVALDCQPDRPLYEVFITQSFPWVYNYIKFNNYLGVFTQFLNLESTFNWNFTDLFVICISYYLTSRFEQVNRRIFAVRGKYMPATFWRTAREDYCRATQLVRQIDDVISGIVFISFANNLYFICLQLFHTLEDGLKGATPNCRDLKSNGLLGGHEHVVYFVYSFVYLMARSLAVSLVAARVHSSARAPAPALYDVPSPVYCIEVQRFLDQVTGDTVALSGLQFFNVTRGLVLTIAGTIVTYELVLVQFNDSSKAASALPFANTTQP